MCCNCCCNLQSNVVIVGGSIGLVVGLIQIVTFSLHQIAYFGFFMGILVTVAAGFYIYAGIRQRSDDFLSSECYGKCLWALFWIVVGLAIFFDLERIMTLNLDPGYVSFPEQCSETSEA